MMPGTRNSLVFFGILFSVSLIFTIAEANNASEYPPTCALGVLHYHLPSQVVPRHYNITLTQMEDVFVGHSSILLEVIHETTSITFHSYDLIINFETLRLLKHEGSHNRQYRIIKWTDFTYCYQSQVFALKFREQLSPGNYTLNINFKAASHSTQGFVVTRNLKTSLESAYITVFEPTGARRLFPCWDEPTFKATFNISVVHSATVQVFSNMPCKNETFNSGVEASKIPVQQTRKTDFHITPVMSTYLVTIAIVENSTDYTTKNNIELHYARNVEKYMKIVRKIAKEANGFLRVYTNKMWRNMTMRILSYRNLPSKSMGAWRFAVFRESDLIYEQKLNFPGRKLAIWKMVASQIARQCIESFVSPLVWSQHWFSHAFATFLGYKIAGKIYNDDVMMQLFVVQILQPALHNDIALNVPPVIHDYDPIYFSLIYKKASAMIKMLEHIATEKVLQEALVQYIKKYAYSSATPINFLWILELKMRELPPKHIKVYWEIMKIMHMWFSQRRYPTLLVTQHVSNKSINFVTIDKGSLNDTLNEWPTPVIFATKPYIRFVQRYPISWKTKELTQKRNSSFDLHGGGPENMIIFNAEQFGYYRVYYESENWVKISNHLNNEDHTKINVLNRAQIIDDAYHFLMDGDFSYIVFYGLIDYLQKETSFIVWHSMMNILHYASPFFNFPESAYFKEHMLQIMNKVLTKIGFYHENKDDEMLKAMRLLLLNWACKHGHVKCREKVHTKLMAHIHDPKNEVISPWWHDWIYCAGLMHVPNYTLPKLLDDLRTQNNDILQYIVCIDDDDLLQNQVEMFLLKPETTQVESVQLRKFFRDLVKRHARKPKVFDFIMSNFDNILPSHMTTMEKIIHIFMSVYSKCQLDKILQYVDKIPSLGAEPSIKYWITFRQDQMQKQKEIFTSRFHNSIFTEKC